MKTAQQASQNADTQHDNIDAQPAYCSETCYGPHADEAEGAVWLALKQPNELLDGEAGIGDDATQGTGP